MVLNRYSSMMLISMADNLISEQGFAAVNNWQNYSFSLAIED
jgi:hypothetical protein